MDYTKEDIAFKDLIREKQKRKYKPKASKDKPIYIFNEKKELVLKKTPQQIESKGKRILKPKSGNVRYDSYKERIEKKGKEMGISIIEFEEMLGKPCYYCGSDEKITIDRINSMFGYIEGNCRPCCFRCNIMKFTATESQFFQQVMRIVKFNNLL